MTYEQALAYISSLEPRGWRLGLDRMRAFCEAAGLDDFLGPEKPKYIHVAGTNGKGSTTAYVQSILVEGNHATGAFFSPYVVDPRERVQIGRNLIPRDDLAEVTQSLIPIAEAFENTEFGGITEFEFKTAVGFAYWKRQGCEWVAMEVGLGGRFDATNVITPAASIVVSVGYDHVHILGDTLAKIAFEKSGIIKPGVPVVMGGLPSEAAEVAQSVADKNGSPLWRWGKEVEWDSQTGLLKTPLREIENLWPGMAGEMQGHNMALSVAALLAADCPLSDEAIRHGAKLAFAPGRFQVVQALGTTILLDGAHNPESARVLKMSVAERYPDRRIALVTNMVQGHEPQDFYGDIITLASSIHVAPIDFHRAFSVETIVEVLQSMGATAQGHAEIGEAINAAAEEAGPYGVVLVTGSFYLVGAALRHLQELN